MVMCYVTDCFHYSHQNIWKYFRFPANKILRQKWVELIGKPCEYNPLVCSCHFVNGDRKNLPTIFDPEIIFDFSTPTKRKEPREQKSGSAVRSLITSFETTTIEERKPEGTISPTPTAISTPSSSQKDLSQSSQIDVTESRSEPESSGTRSSSRLSSEASLAAENYFLLQEVEQLKNKSTAFSYSRIINDDKLVLFYTGIPSNHLYNILLEMMAPLKLQYYAGWNVIRINRCDQLLMTLMKLRLNLRHTDLAVRFETSTRTVTNIIMTWIYALHEILFQQLMATIPSRKKNATCLPAAFVTFASCRIVLDCTEVTSDIPRRMDKQRQMYSAYKHRNTWKVLVGVAPNGVITYCSKCYPGATSDKKIVEHSGVMQFMEPGDLILADKGFLIREHLPQGVSLNIPPFVSHGKLTETQVYETERIARARIHVERAINRLKGFHILDHIPHHYNGHISIIAQTCAALTNLQYPLIKSVQDYYNE